MMSSTRLLGNLAAAMMCLGLPAVVAADQPFFVTLDRFPQGEKCASVSAVSANGSGTVDGSDIRCFVDVLLDWEQDMEIAKNKQPVFAW